MSVMYMQAALPKHEYWIQKVHFFQKYTVHVYCHHVMLIITRVLSDVTGIYESILTMIHDTDHLLMQASVLQPGQKLRPPLPVDITGHGVGRFVFWFNRLCLIHRLLPYQHKICEHLRRINIMNEHKNIT